MTIRVVLHHRRAFCGRKRVDRRQDWSHHWQKHALHIHNESLHKSIRVNALYEKAVSTISSHVSGINLATNILLIAFSSLRKMTFSEVFEKASVIATQRSSPPDKINWPDLSHFIVLTYMNSANYADKNLTHPSWDGNAFVTARE